MATYSQDELLEAGKMGMHEGFVESAAIISRHIEALKDRFGGEAAAKSALDYAVAMLTEVRKPIAAMAESTAPIPHSTAA